MTQALEGVRVLDLTRVLSGPYCTMLLADLGAEVIKIEGPGAAKDLTREDDGASINGETLYFMAVNRNKRGMLLNLKTPEGIAVFKELVAVSDVVVENNRPGVMERLGIGYEQLKEINDQLIFVSISGFGRNSPYEHKLSFDNIAQAMSGIMSINGQPDSPPTKVGISLGDTSTSLFAAFSIVSALYARKTQGVGQYVDASMVDSLFALLEMSLFQYLVNGTVPGRVGSRHPTSYPYDTFRAADGYFVIGTATNRAFLRLCEAMEMPGLIEQEEYATDTRRGLNDKALKAIIEKWAGDYTVEQIVAKLESHMVPVAPVWNIEQIATSEHIQSREMLAEVEHPVAGTTRLPQFPVKLSQTPARINRPAPTLGQHTEEILAGLLGYDAAKLGKLKESGAI